MLKDWVRITDLPSYIVSPCDPFCSLSKVAAFKKSLICHKEEECISLFVTYESCFCREVSIIIGFIKITLKTNVDFLHHFLHKLALNLHSDAKEFNISVLCSFGEGGQIY